MKRSRRKRTAFDVVLAAMGLICALLLGAVFYGTMVYQLADVTKVPENAEEEQTAVGEDGRVRLLMLPEERATLMEETEQEIRMGGQVCRVIIREYATGDGGMLTATTATPAGYIERLADEGWKARMMTGFQLAGMDAIFCSSEAGLLVAARSGEIVYMLEGNIDEQAMYELSVSALRE